MPIDPPHRISPPPAAAQARLAPPITELAAVLAALHRSCEPGDEVGAALPRPHTVDVDDALEGAGFTIVADRRRDGRSAVQLHREWTLPDTVAPGLSLLVCGLNPSPAAADAGVGFAHPGNRFWPAAIAAGAVRVARDPDAALAAGVGMTDIVKRPTRRASELSTTEYRRGMARLDRVVALHRPGAVCVVGLAGWRAAVDRRAIAGIQHERIGGRPVYLMPSTSGLNAHVTTDELATHLRAATALVGER